MSVTIHDYLVANDNKLTALLNHEDLDGAFIENTLIKIHPRDDDWWCDFLLDYTLTCNDLACIANVFSGYWWCVSPHYGDHRYVLSVNLKSSLQ